MAVPISLPNVVLNSPMILVSESTSVLGITSNGSDLIFGTVCNVYATSDKFVLNESVFFNKSNAINILYSGQGYYLLDEKFIFGYEIAALP